ncbi:uncharacterized protein K452DRAFT_253627 [Aplosporella prunicola CBS 121167]|uniref:Histidine kinase n=1 Tax=Aplosporella prunicola CBS 121167 TaxID=1176127 RepID=A0A6A6B9H1_9PEZI|nr:uncharacterized protein K452DRAFT_253627 [Aplosporella prunicola CBS 121167]KAF2139955.1 hypothetical protein K452DRAFT_253627 [Aplosporella prunicola CBS 121167]
MNNPRSIFTGRLDPSDPPRNLETRRLTTPEYRATLSTQPADPPKPPEATAHEENTLFARPIWHAKLDCHSEQSSSPAGAAKLLPLHRKPFVLSSKPAEKRTFPQTSPQRGDITSEPLHKRRKLQTRSRHTLDAFDFPRTFDRNGAQPPSPLFFSNTKRARPPLPARFSSSEAAARMLSNAREDSGIKTVTLARGTYSGSSPTSAPGRASFDRASLSPVSPDLREKAELPRALGQIGIAELLEQDWRPTFIVDLGDASNYGPVYLNVVFGNSALRSNVGLLELVSGTSVNDAQDSVAPRAFVQFKTWLLGSVVHGESLDVCIPPYLYGGLSWTIATIRKRYRVISGNATAAHTPSSTSPSTTTLVVNRDDRASTMDSVHPVLPSTEGDTGDYFGNAAATTSDPGASPRTTGPVYEPSTPSGLTGSSLLSTRAGFTDRLLGATMTPGPLAHPSITNECVLRAAVAGDVDAFFSNNDGSNRKEIGFFDWTRLPIDSDLPKHIQFARSIDWASTPLGPIEFWPSDLRQMCNLIMASPHPAAMYWGDDLVAIYNEAYVLLAGQKHPLLMGQSYKDAWVEIWEEVKDVFADAKRTGQATMKDDDCLFIKRTDYLEETYFSWSIIPMIGNDGTVMGLYNPAFEKTRRKIAERRMLTLREVGERTASARDIRSFWEQVLSALATNEHDTPFALVYSVSDDADSDSSSMHSSSILGTKQCLLEGSLGVPPGHPCAPDRLELKTSMEGFGPVLREVMKTDRPVLLEVGTGDLPPQIIEGIGGRGFDDPVRSVIVCPIHPTTGESILGFLVLGVNPRRPYDDDYSLFIQLLSRQLATSLASVVLFEEEIRRGQRAAKLAALDRMELSEQLAARTQEARDSETRFTRMAEFSPAGLFIANSEGHITYCNDTWYEISRVNKDTNSTDKWIDAVKPEDQQMVVALWNKLVDHTEPATAEFRFKAPWEDKNGNRTDTWVLFSAYPEKNDHGTLKSVFGTITNISQQKWAEGFQKRKMEEAVELKRQQENFIDITSHEMRNPLSAILQCADEISSTMIDFRNTGSMMINEELINNSIDAAQTIALCAQHQKRIVDDILTLSKLDSAMLLVTPVDVQPLTVVQRALKMFEGELATADIHMEFLVDESFKKLNVDWVRLDPSRVMQVLINLTTNAIKFTTTESRRTIRVTIAASTEKPSKLPNRPVNYFPTRSKRVDMTHDNEWGDGEDIFVHFAVQDTGRGLNEEEKKLLFLRFSQASPRTHVQYGGSGLGLFISRELTELQGGEIGVASEAGKGSTFAFYVKAKRSHAPEDPVEQLSITLPRQPTEVKGKKKDQEAAVKTKDFATATAADQPSSPATSASQKAKDRGRINVLVVEDNLVNQKVLQKQLKHQGYNVLVANHGGECLEKLRDSTHFSKPISDNPAELSVLLMDQEMPVMDGLACTREIREWEADGRITRHLPIIAVTANARSEQIAQLLAAGMDDVVSKPFRIPDLVPKIDELAAKYLDPVEGAKNVAARISHMPDSTTAVGSPRSEMKK